MKDAQVLQAVPTRPRGRRRTHATQRHRGTTGPGRRVGRRPGQELQVRVHAEGTASGSHLRGPFTLDVGWSTAVSPARLAAQQAQGPSSTLLLRLRQGGAKVPAHGFGTGRPSPEGLGRTG